MDPYLNAEPLIPVPKVRINEAFTVEQLIMLWLIWASGVTLGTLAFMFELCTSVSLNICKRTVTSSNHDIINGKGKRMKLKVSTIKVQEYVSTM